MDSQDKLFAHIVLVGVEASAGCPALHCCGNEFVLAGMFGAVQSNQPLCCPCEIAHVGLVNPTYVYGPLTAMSPPGDAWQFSGDLVVQNYTFPKDSRVSEKLPTATLAVAEKISTNQEITVNDTSCFNVTVADNVW